MHTPPPSAFGLYLHYPWCIQKCPYCDFNSYTKNKKDSDPAYTDALILDLANCQELVGSRMLKSVFFGGGTPSLMSVETLEKITKHIKQYFNCAQDLEITLEMNPASLEWRKLQCFFQLGVNRLSIGGQSFSNAHLAKLGRIHTSDMIPMTYQSAVNAGFQNINLDIMYHLPSQSCDEALTDLEQALSLGANHFSWYELTYEPNTVFAKSKPKRLNHDDAFSIYEQGCAILKSRGYQRYEVSAFTQNAPCQHNLNYWTFGDYLGVGAGAHSKWTNNQGEITRWQKTKSPHGYTKAPLGRLYTRTIVGQEQLFEYMLGRLRLFSPIEKEEFEFKSGATWEQLLHIVQNSEHASLFSPHPTHLQLSPKGQLFLNDAVGVFIT